MMKFARFALVLLALCAPAYAQVQSGFPTANQVYAGPASGPAAQPAFRALVPQDLPSSVPLNVKSCGAKGDGSTNDTTAIQTCINNLVAAGGGKLVFPAAPNCYITNSQLTVDMSGATGEYSDRIILEGEGSGNTCIKNTTSATALLRVVGSAAQPQLKFGIRGLRVVGALVSSSICLQSAIWADGYLDDFFAFGCDIGFDATDTEQIQIENSYFVFNNKGIRANVISSASAPNSWTLTNTAITNNTLWGMQITTGFALTITGGSIQFNGSIACGGTIVNCWGLSIQNMGGAGVGASATIQGVDFEGNGGTADVIVNQTTAANWTVNLQSNSFNRNTAFATLGYGTNNVLVSGSQAGTLRLGSNVFTSSNGYTPSAGRPVVSVTNTSASIFDDGTNQFTNATEVQTPPYPAGQSISVPITAGGVGYPMMLAGVLHNVNLNSANTDNAMAVVSPTANYRIQALTIQNIGTTASLTTVTAGFFTATGGGGTTIYANQALNAITSNVANNTANGLSMTQTGAGWYNATTLQFRVGTAQGASATANVYLFIQPLP